MVAAMLCTLATSLAGAISPIEMRYLALEIESTLRGDSRTVLHQLTVDVEDGHIVLSGTTPDDATRDFAERLAKRVALGYDVDLVNRIRVAALPGAKKSVAKPTSLDQKQMEKLLALLDSQFPDISKSISLNFELTPMPLIELQGLIPSYEDKLMISRIIQQNYQSLPVVNNLMVRRYRRDGGSEYQVTRGEEQARIADQRQAAESGEVTSDEILAQQLKTALEQDPLLQGFQINVTVENGVVWLSGSVISFSQKVRAIRLARLDGRTRYVIDQLAVTPPKDPLGTPPPPPDLQDVAAYLQQYLDRRVPDLRGSAVTVRGGTVIVIPADTTLTSDELKELEQRIWQVPEFKGFSIAIRPATTIEGGKPAQP